ncbi:hypothetical protein LJC63_04465 [Ruminococcaceae bacterium OttesenSCG-928-L11]|nr:hypothetical protein [Ruminococcaceae bacterium OttesenSCG-928-L11]
MRMKRTLGVFVEKGKTLIDYPEEQRGCFHSVPMKRRDKYETVSYGKTD